MTTRLLPLIAVLALCGCGQPAKRQSLLGDFAAPGTYALAGDTITVWQRVRQPDGAWRFHSYSITPSGTIEYLDELERADAPEAAEDSHEAAERRRSFVLPQPEFEALRSQVALLRPAALGPDDPVRGYAGEAYPAGCTPAPAKTPAPPRLAGINFLNAGSWGAFVLQPGCDSNKAKAAAAVMTDLFGRLERAADQARRR
jgi:hypothetical protein